MQSVQPSHHIAGAKSPDAAVGTGGRPARSRGVVDDGISRTDLAEDRTILANERTFAGWIRTSLGCIALGVGFHALFNKMEPWWAPRAIATAFLLLAALIAWLAERRSSAVASRLSTHVVQRARRVNLRLIAACISLGAAALGVAIWLLPIR